MRTPMNTVIGMTQLALLNPDIEKKDEYLGKIRTASDHLLGVINDVLDMSKIDANKMTLAQVEFNVKEILDRVKIVVSQAIFERKQNFTMTIDETIPEWLIGDDQRFTQVLTNIVSNAIKFTPDGGSISLRATLDQITNDTCRLQIDVTDTGIGISKDQQKNLFQAFEQADKDISRKYGGTGLGLALSKRIIEMMGGQIRVQSALGQGSTFTFDCQFELLKTQPTLHGAELNKDEKTLDWTGHVILLAEDIEINREIVREVLLPTHVTILEAENGEMAIALFEKNNIDLILMDIQMPVMDGYEATKYIRQLPSANAQTVPIIAMTANVFKEDIDQCIAAGMNEHLGKPIDFTQLFNILTKYLH
jgi:CheY-like chemotaxis protein